LPDIVITVTLNGAGENNMKSKAKRVPGKRRTALPKVAAKKAPSRTAKARPKPPRRSEKPAAPQAESQAPANSRAKQEMAEAHHRLIALRARIGKHPELEEAIEKVEMALNQLTLSTGGML
jgi:hypothetical protein